MRKERPAWKPSTLEEVDVKALREKYFNYKTPKLNFPPTKPFVEYPTDFGLPTEQYIGELILGLNPEYVHLISCRVHHVLTLKAVLVHSP